jgi:hypothetical protein
MKTQHIFLICVLFITLYFCETRASDKPTIDWPRFKVAVDLYSEDPTSPNAARLNYFLSNITRSLKLSTKNEREQIQHTCTSYLKSVPAIWEQNLPLKDKETIKLGFQILGVTEIWFQTDHLNGILQEVIKSHPRLFLVELKNAYPLYPKDLFEQLVCDYRRCSQYSLEGHLNELELRKRLLKGVNDKHLYDIRKGCIDLLEKRSKRIRMQINNTRADEVIPRILNGQWYESENYPTMDQWLFRYSFGDALLSMLINNPAKEDAWKALHKFASYVDAHLGEEFNNSCFNAVEQYPSIFYERYLKGDDDAVNRMINALSGSKCDDDSANSDSKLCREKEIKFLKDLLRKLKQNKSSNNRHHLFIMTFETELKEADNRYKKYDQ